MAADRADPIRPFTVNVPQEEIDDLRRRIAATRWPDSETVGDASQGPQLANVRELVNYWGSDYDWRKAEAQLNSLPQFLTTIDGVDVHFIHVRSKHPNAFRLVISHGWPGSVFEQIKLIGPLTDPTAFGGRAEDAFDVVIPSLPGFGFSSHPTEAGWGLERIGHMFDVLMKRVGYTTYVAQGGDWGAGVVQAMGRQAPEGLLGIHTNLPAAIPDEVGPALGGGPLPAGITAEEKASVLSLGKFLKQGNLTYVAMMNARPQGVSYGHADSPAALQAGCSFTRGSSTGLTERTPASLRHETKSGRFHAVLAHQQRASSARLYWENRGRSLTSASAQKTSEIALPVAVTVFPDEVYQPPRVVGRARLQQPDLFP